MRYCIWAFVLCSAMLLANVVAVQPDQECDYVSISAPDARAVFEIKLDVSSTGVCEKTENLIYIIPKHLASKVELERRKASSQTGEISSGNKSGVMQDIKVEVVGKTVQVELFCYKITDYGEVTREAAFSVPFFQNIDGRLAGIKYTITWRELKKALKK